MKVLGMERRMFQALCAAGCVVGRRDLKRLFRNQPFKLTEWHKRCASCHKSFDTATMDVYVGIGYWRTARMVSIPGWIVKHLRKYATVEKTK
eukprot:6187538-Pleurochrysis_carterae.AAC.2